MVGTGYTLVEAEGEVVVRQAEEVGNVVAAVADVAAIAVLHNHNLRKVQIVQQSV